MLIIWTDNGWTVCLSYYIINHLGFHHHHRHHIHTHTHRLWFMNEPVTCKFIQDSNKVKTGQITLLTTPPPPSTHSHIHTCIPWKTNSTHQNQSDSLSRTFTLYDWWHEWTTNYLYICERILLNVLLFHYNHPSPTCMYTLCLEIWLRCLKNNFSHCSA